MSPIPGAPALAGGVGQGDLQGSLPTLTVLRLSSPCWTASPCTLPPGTGRKQRAWGPDFGRVRAPLPGEVAPLGATVCPAPAKGPAPTPARRPPTLYPAPRPVQGPARPPPRVPSPAGPGEAAPAGVALTAALATKASMSPRPGSPARRKDTPAAAAAAPPPRGGAATPPSWSWASPTCPSLRRALML